MEIEIQSKTNNPLLKRTEVHFTIHHDGGKTPKRELIRSELAEKLKGMNDVDTVVFDGVITHRLVNIAVEKNIKYLIAARISGKIKPQLEVKLITFLEIQGLWQ